jgi:hypothetical protein
LESHWYPNSFGVGYWKGIWPLGYYPQNIRSTVPFAKTIFMDVFTPKYQLIQYHMYINDYPIELCYLIMDALFHSV